MYRHLAFALLEVATASCADERTYSTAEVVDTFQQHGYTLVVRALPDGMNAAEGDLLTTRGGQPFIVVVASNAEADDAWPDYEAQQARDSFDARRANVIVIADDGLGVRQRTRVLAALSSLPNRGAAVRIAFDRRNPSISDSRRQ